ncbi:MAG: hypothetical protein K9G33_08365 [Sneathiella sp.]|nr:hypothetical protein [Sneathiella sp.]
MRRIFAAALLLMVTACAGPFAQLSERDQLLLTCDGLATTMGIVRNFVIDGTIKDREKLQNIRASSLIVEETCLASTDYASALSKLAAQSVVLLDARLAAEAAASRGG